jgi:putative DNA primase/helicase
VRVPDLAENAAQVAPALGPVFRVRPRDKRPLGAGWQREATQDPRRIALLWRGRPDANIGLACGHRCWVLDVDGDEGLATLADLEDLHRWLPIGPASITGSGGMHLFFAADDWVRNSVRRLGSGLDTRGKGGFVVLPPSIHPNGARYRWLQGREPWSVELPTAPTWLLALLEQPRPAPSTILTTGMPTIRSSPNAAAALARALDAVAGAKEGERNATLFRAAAGLGRFLVKGDLVAPAIGPALVGVAMAVGLSRDEAERTAASGLQAGVRGAA